MAGGDARAPWAPPRSPADEFFGEKYATAAELAAAGSS